MDLEEMKAKVVELDHSILPAMHYFAQVNPAKVAIPCILYVMADWMGKALAGITDPAQRLSVMESTFDAVKDNMDNGVEVMAQMDRVSEILKGKL